MKQLYAHHKKIMHNLYNNVNSDLTDLLNWFRPITNTLAFNVNQSNYAFPNRQYCTFTFEKWIKIKNGS